LGRGAEGKTKTWDRELSKEEDFADEKSHTKNLIYRWSLEKKGEENSEYKPREERGECVP